MNSPKSKAPLLIKAALALAVGVLAAVLFGSRQPTKGTAGSGESVQAAPAATRTPDPRQSPPVFTTPASTLGLQTDPRAPDYDAARLVKVTGKSVASIFAAEPRDPVWAPAMEQRQREIARKDIEAVGLTGKIRNVECKTQVCKVILEAPDQTALTQTRRLFEIANLATMSTAGRSEGPPGLSEARYIMFDTRWRDLEANQEMYKTMRQRKLQQLTEMRKGRALDPDEPPSIPRE
jgi:hypothetical protein